MKVDLEKYILHPDWNTFYQHFDADIAIIFVTPEITYNTFIQPICLPAVVTNVINVRGTVAGYGLREGSNASETKPRHVTISSVDDETCFESDKRFETFGSSRYVP